jgi:subtilisin family serine protease
MKRKAMKRNESSEAVPPSARFRPDPNKRLEFMPGQMIVKIKGPALGSTVGTLRAGGARLAARVQQELPDSVSGPLDYLEANAGLKQATALFAKDVKHKLPGLKASRLAAISSVSDSPHEDLQGYTVVSMDPKKVTAALMRHVSRSNAIQFAEQMPARWIAARRQTLSVPTQEQQWGLGAIGWFQAKRPTNAQARRITVAVLDSGIDETHPNLEGVALSYDHRGKSAEDIIGHGTHVAGIIAAVVNRGIGITGVAACQLAVWKIFDDQPTQGDFYVNGELYLRALGLLPDRGCTVVNLSIGGTQQSQAEALLFRRLRARNIVVVAAMGNEHEEGNPIEFPAAYADVLAVGAISSELRRASFSNTGRHIWVVAPGQGILSTVPMKKSPYRKETEYVSWNGTSMATPHVAGAVALYRAKKAGVTFDQVANALKRTAKALPQMRKRKFTEELGHGLVYLPSLL